MCDPPATLLSRVTAADKKTIDHGGQGHEHVPRAHPDVSHSRRPHAGGFLAGLGRELNGVLLTRRQGTPHARQTDGHFRQYLRCRVGRCKALPPLPPAAVFQHVHGAGKG